MNVHEKTDELDGEDRQLVDLVTTALVDPNLHTDLRMRLHGEITGLLQTARERTSGPSEREMHERPLAPEDSQLQRMLRAVLVDPNLNTDLRMRLHQDIPKLVRAAQEHGGAAEPDRG